MKTLVTILFLCGFAYLAFVPPSGMKKFPTARVEFSVDTSYGSISGVAGPAE